MIICIIFLVAFCQIRRGILDHPRETKLDQMVLKFQMKTLRLLKIVIGVSFFVAIFLLAANLMALVQAKSDGSKTDCNQGVFTHWYLNVPWWTFSRLLTGVSGQITGLCIFWKRRSSLTREEIVKRQNERSYMFGSTCEELENDDTFNDQESSEESDGENQGASGRHQ